MNFKIIFHNFKHFTAPKRLKADLTQTSHRRECEGGLSCFTLVIPYIPSSIIKLSILNFELLLITPRVLRNSCNKSYPQESGIKAEQTCTNIECSNASRRLNISYYVYTN